MKSAPWVTEVAKAESCASPETTSTPSATGFFERRATRTRRPRLASRPASWDPIWPAPKTTCRGASGMWFYLFSERCTVGEIAQRARLASKRRLESARRMNGGNSMSTQDVVLYAVDAGIATITLNRPERRNAINIAVAERLHALWEQ